MSFLYNVKIGIQKTIIVEKTFFDILTHQKDLEIAVFGRFFETNSGKINMQWRITFAFPVCTMVNKRGFVCEKIRKKWCPNFAQKSSKSKLILPHHSFICKWHWIMKIILPYPLSDNLTCCHTDRQLHNKLTKEAWHFGFLSSLNACISRHAVDMGMPNTSTLVLAHKL